MPTGYTCLIENGKVNSGKEFLKVCIRQFGCCIGQRDDPLSAPLITKIEPSPYYKERYEEALEELKKIENMDSTSKELSKQRMIEEWQKELKAIDESIEEQKLLITKYSRIEEEVMKWIPPTPEHEGIKRFALEQIRISMPSLEYYEEKKAKLLNKKEFEEDYEHDIEDTIRCIKRDIEYYKEKMLEEEKRIADRNLFLKQFIDSLEEV